MRYRFHVTDNKVICVSSYAGRAVRGVAKCDPNDDFDESNGMKLAQARCDYKVAKKRVNRAMSKHVTALKKAAEAKDYADKMLKYYTESFEEFVKASEELAKLEEFMKN